MLHCGQGEGQHKNNLSVSGRCCLQAKQRTCVVHVVFCRNSSSNEQWFASMPNMWKYSSNVAEFRMIIVSFAAKNMICIHISFSYYVFVIPNFTLTCKIVLWQVVAYFVCPNFQMKFFSWLVVIQLKIIHTNSVCLPCCILHS